MKSEQYILPQEMSVPYYEETQKRTFRQKCIKIRNTILQLLAYSCPNNKIRIFLHRKRGVHIGQNVYLGMFCYLDNLWPSYIYIEDNASINAGSMILTHFNPMQQYKPVMRAYVAPVLIKHGAIVAVRSTILPGIEIGKFSLTSAGSVVTKSIRDYTMVQGNPAKVVAEYSELMQNKVNEELNK